MRNVDVSPYFSAILEEAQKAALESGSLFADEAEDAAAALDAPFTDTDDLIEAVQKASRIVAIRKAGLEKSAAFKAALEQYKPAGWKDFAPMGADVALQHTMGAKLLNLVTDDKPRAVAFHIGYHSNHIADFMIRDLMERKIPFLIDVPDATFTRLLIGHAGEDGVRAFAEYKVGTYEKITNRVSAVPNSMPASPAPSDAEKMKIYDTIMRGYQRRVSSGEVLFTLTAFPTEIDAELDGIPLDQYLKLHFEMSDQPDALIEAANARLIERLNQTTTVRFTNSDGTDISMELVDDQGKHFTFCNSQARKNVPGSEVFSAARRDSLNGVIVAKGKFNPKSDKGSVIENLTLRFKDGKIISFEAEKNAAAFQAFLDRDPNNAYTGELGIGTNPHLKRHVLNGLLVEKIGGSFHLALGDAYTMTDYLGTPVYVDNGNRSIDHWDVTTMLHGKEGRMYLDGAMVMEDGLFLDPALDILNRGWAAVPVEERPDYWRDYKGPFTGE